MARRAGRSSATDYANLKASVLRLGDRSRLAVRICIVLLPLFVVILQTQTASILQELILSRRPFALYELAIILWFACWGYGAHFDVAIQEKVLIADGADGAFDVRLMATIAGFFVVAVGMLYLYRVEVAFQAALTAFVVANMLALLFPLNRRSLVAIERSREEMRADRDNFGIERVAIVESYLTGAWQKRRFATMIAMAVGQLVLAALWRFTDAPRLLGRVRYGSLEGAAAAPYVPAMAFLLFVLISEGWIMRERQRTAAMIEALDELGRRYSLRRRTA